MLEVFDLQRRKANNREYCEWRREWDSNPRYGFPYTRFPSVRLQPLGHLSKPRREAQYSGGRTRYNPRRQAFSAAQRKELSGLPLVVDGKRGNPGGTLMGRGLLLWLLGIPLPIILVIWLLGGLHG